LPVNGATRLTDNVCHSAKEIEASQFQYVDVAPEPVELPAMREIPYVRPPMHEQTFVPRVF